MLSVAERSTRQDFYVRIFGEEKFRDSKIFSGHLWPVKAYSEKITGLTERGFKNPQKMITSFPAILGYSFDNIDEKIAGLTERGFKNPQKMITSLPTILGYSFDNIDRKLRLCRHLRIDVGAFIAYTIVFIGVSPKHYIPIARKLRKDGKETTPRNVFAVYRAKTF